MRTSTTTRRFATGRWHHMLALAAYTALGIWFTWPLAAQMQTTVIQKGSVPVDSGQIFGTSGGSRTRCSVAATLF